MSVISQKGHILKCYVGFVEVRNRFYVILVFNCTRNCKHLINAHTWICGEFNFRMWLYQGPTTSCHRLAGGLETVIKNEFWPITECRRYLRESFCFTETCTLKGESGDTCSWKWIELAPYIAIHSPPLSYNMVMDINLKICFLRSVNKGYVVVTRGKSKAAAVCVGGEKLCHLEKLQFVN